MKKVILITAALLTMASSAFAQIGSLAADLVFTPITPCRIVDTRGAGGVIPAASSRVFKGWAANYTAQGGSGTNCGLPQTTDIAAIATNLLVIVPAAEGWIAAWPVGTTMPLVSNLNYKANDVLANSAILKINQTTADFNVYTVAATHLAVDVTGYYSKPVSSGSLECVNTALKTTSIAASSSAAVAANSCASGYIATSATCDTSVSGVYMSGSGMNGNSPSAGAYCRFFNSTGSAQSAYTSSTCCRIPGR